jgi:predicted glutamine amidotransferase
MARSSALGRCAGAATDGARWEADHRRDEEDDRTVCRLLGWASRPARPLAGLLGAEDLHAFTELSCTHGDGWGAARSTGTGVQVVRDPDAARTSAAFADWASGTPSDLGMVHLRWATLGLAVRPENTHPFTDGTVAFAHNGSIRPPAALDPLVGDGVRALRAGDTDSERYFLAVLSRLREGATPAGALAATVTAIAASTDFSSLNALLLTPDQLVAVCRPGPEADQHAEGPDYFALRYRAGDDAVVVSSSGWGRDWHELADGELLTVDRGTLAVTVRPVEELAAVG